MGATDGKITHLRECNLRCNLCNTRYISDVVHLCLPGQGFCANICRDCIHKVMSAFGYSSWT